MKLLKDTYYNLRASSNFALHNAKTKVIFEIFALIFLLLLPPIIGYNSRWLEVICIVTLFTISALGLNIVQGFCGLLHLGYAGFMSIGAYTSAILMRNLGFPFWIALPITVLHCGLWGVILGAPTLRLAGDYFAIVTLGFAELVFLISRNWTSVTGGASGFHNVPRPYIFNYEFTRVPPTAYWYLILGLLIITIYIVTRLSKSRLGRAWFAIREDEIAAKICGINIMYYKTLGFAVSAAIAGACGSFWSAFYNYVNWSNFNFMMSALILCMVVLGGMGSITGVILGGILLGSLNEVLREVIYKFKFPPDTRFLLYGALLVLIVRYKPEGLIPNIGVSRELRHMKPPEDHLPREEMLHR